MNTDLPLPDAPLARDPNAVRVPANIRANPPPDHATVIARAQSILTRNGRVGPLLKYEAAQLVIECAKKAKPRVAA